MTFRLLTARLLVAGSLLAAAEAASAQEIYVPNFDDGDVSVVDAPTLATLARIPVTTLADPDITWAGEPVEGNPTDVAFDTRHAFAFVLIGDGDDTSNLVAVINTSTRAVVKYIEIEPVSFDGQITLRPGGDRLYVTSCFDPGYPERQYAGISVIDVATQSFLGSIPTPGGNYTMEFSPNGSIGYTTHIDPTCGEPTGISIFDLSGTGAVDGHIATSQDVSDLAIAPDGSYGLATGGERILVIQFGTVNAETGAVQCGADDCLYGWIHGVVFNRRGTRAYALDTATNELITIDTASMQELSRVTVPTSLHGDPFVPVPVWELFVRDQCAVVIAYDYPSELLMFNISNDVPVFTSMAPVGNFAYNMEGWGRLTCPLPDEGGGGSGDRGNVHGAGRLVGHDKLHFEFHAKIKRDGALSGHCKVDDRSNPRRVIRCLDVTSVTISGNTATITGRALDNGVPTTYEIVATDNGSPGKDGDLFAISTASGFVKAGAIRSGNITIKKKK